MVNIECKKKIDSYGRITIPQKVRERFFLNAGDECEFFEHVGEDGSLYLCIKCPGVENEIEKAKKLLESQGFKFNS